MKTKKLVTTLLTADEVAKAVQLYSESTSRLTTIQGELELKLIAVREEYQEEITELNLKIDKCTEDLQYYAEVNKEKLFKDKRSMDLLHGTIGFRYGNWKLEKAKKITWEIALMLIKKINKKLVRTTEEINKKAIIDMREDKKLMEKMEKIGITVVQDETFYVDSKKEELIEA